MQHFAPGWLFGILSLMGQRPLDRLGSDVDGSAGGTWGRAEGVSPFNLRLWFGVTGFAVIVMIGAACAGFVSRFLTDHLLQREAVVTQEFLESVVRAEGSAGRLMRAGPTEHNPDLASFVSHIRGMSDVLRANVYTAERQILWSTDPKIIGRTFPANHELDEALENHLVTEIGTISDNSKAEHVNLAAGASGHFIEAYIPLRDGDTVVGVVELYKVPTALEATIQEARRLIWTGAAGAMLLLYLALFWVVQRGARQIERQQSALGRMEALAAVGQMASAIAHSLRNPMAGIRSTAELLQLDSPSAAEASAEIIGEVDRLDGYVRELLDYARTETVTLQSIDPAELVHEMLSRLRDRFQRTGVSAEVWDERDERSHVDVDPQLLMQAFTSIATNAVEAMPGGGHLQVRLATVGPQAAIEFADDGTGIPPETMARIGEPFVTTKTRGLGLGLALVRRIVERFGGRLEIESPRGAGARVRVMLPTARRARRA